MATCAKPLTAMTLATCILSNQLNYSMGSFDIFNAACIKDTAHLIDCIEHGATINQQDKGGNTPLHYAIQHGQTENVKILMEHGADSTIQNKGHKMAWGIWGMQTPWEAAIERTTLISTLRPQATAAILTTLVTSEQCIKKLLEKGGTKQICRDLSSAKKALGSKFPVELDRILKGLRTADELTYKQARTFIIGRIASQGSLIATLPPEVMRCIFYFVKIENNKMAIIPSLQGTLLLAASSAKLPQPLSAPEKINLHSPHNGLQ